MFAQAVEKILRDHCPAAVVRAIEQGAAPGSLWQAIEGAGFLELLTPEEHGGAGLALAELFDVLVLFGRHALPVPAGQAILARAVLPAACAPTGLLTLAPRLLQAADGTWSCPLVPFGEQATHVLAGDGAGWVLLDAGQATRVKPDMPGVQSASLVWQDGGAVVQAGPLARPDLLESLGAALHAALIVGALQKVFELTLAHCNDRVQFGRPLGQFQAVQHQLALMAEHLAAASLATQAAFAVPGSTPGAWPAALAKARASAAAAFVSAGAHALHGALGVTEDHDLQLYTRRLHAWRMAHGSEVWWHRRIGEAVLQSKLSLTGFVSESEGAPP